MKLSDINLGRMEKMIRMNIRNAYIGESMETLRKEAINRAARGKWFETSCLLELASED